MIPPNPCPRKPKPSALSKRKDVTVALAINAIGGSVVATDRQQTEGELKLNWGKMSAQWALHRGSLVIAGAGNGPYLDAIGTRLGDWFRDDPDVPIGLDELEQDLQKKHKDFYREYVLPFEAYPYNERPDYELLLVASPEKAGDRIWTTHKLVIHRERDFAAVGCGRTVARALLDKFHIPGLPIDVAINLAAYVLWQVKQTVDGVGFETDMFEIRRGRPAAIIPRDEIAAMEAQFRSYQKVEVATLYYCLGGTISEAQRQNWDFDAEEETRKKLVREFFEKLSENRFKKSQTQ